MAISAKKLQIPETITLLDKGCEFQGKLSFEGVVRIDGVFRGEIFSQDHLIIGEGALVEASIQVGTLEVGGRFKGQLIARDRLIIHSTGQVEAEVKTKDLEVQLGALIDGNLEMGNFRDSKLVSTEPLPSLANL
ncbi:MAG: polymer-forming cytoskeletal protein [Bradymonadales bacterium]|nr:MAG: polymer-forming cytoskeletal protein [Bradymonadales bacterium]